MFLFSSTTVPVASLSLGNVHWCIARRDEAFLIMQTKEPQRRKLHLTLALLFTAQWVHWIILMSPIRALPLLTLKLHPVIFNVENSTHTVWLMLSFSSCHLVKPNISWLDLTAVPLWASPPIVSVLICIHVSWPFRHRVLSHPTLNTEDAFLLSSFLSNLI